MTPEEMLDAVLHAGFAVTLYKNLRGSNICVDVNKVAAIPLLAHSESGMFARETLNAAVSRVYNERVKGK